MHGEWVVVADSAFARVFQRGDSELQLVQSLKHPESREQNKDLMGNRPNQNEHGMEKDLKGNEPHALRDAEAARFAKEVAHFLGTAHAQNRFGSLVLVSEPRFLGSLRGELSGPVAKCVTRSLHRHATHLKTEALHELLSAEPHAS